MRTNERPVGGYHDGQWWPVRRRLVEAWAEDAAFMKRQPGFISTQLHRGTAGSSTFVNVAEWVSARALGEAFRSPEFQARMGRYPDSAVASPHVFERIAVPGI